MALKVCPEGAPEPGPVRAPDVQVQCPASAIQGTGPEHPIESSSPRDIPPSKPSSRKHRPHRSKITQLPAAIREFINESLYNHVSHKNIIQSLAEKGHPGINGANLTAWTKSGYKLWVQERERFHCLRLVSENSEKLFHDLDANGKHHADRLSRLLINMHMAQAMHDFDPTTLKEQLRKDPLNFFKFVHANHAQCLSRQRDDRLEVLRHKAGIGRKTGPNELGRQSVKAAFNLPDSWFNTTEPKDH